MPANQILFQSLKLQNLSSANVFLSVVVSYCYICVSCFQPLNPSATKGSSSCVASPQRRPRKSKMSSTSSMMITAATLRSLSSSV